MRVVGPAPMGGEFVEIVMDEPPLRNAMLRFSGNILLLSLLISGITATLVYLALHYLFVRPMRRITANMMAFRADPENAAASSCRRRAPTRSASPSASSPPCSATSPRCCSRRTGSPRSGSRCRRSITICATCSPRRSCSPTGCRSCPIPTVQRFAPKLMRALERAIAFCQSTLSYGRAQEPPPDRRPILLEPLVEEVHETLGLGARCADPLDQRGRARPDRRRRPRSAVPRAAQSRAQCRAGAGKPRRADDPGRDQIRITGRREGAVVVIEVSDTGPGFSEKARAHLFEAFQGSTRTGGTGLGLAIAAELVRAHGGEIRLVEGTIGATFRITIPDRAVELDARRGARAPAR